MARPLPDDMLNILEENAKRASFHDKEQGDAWRCNHGYVLNRENTICHPAFYGWHRDTTLDGYPTSDAPDALSRFIAAASPRNVLALVNEVRTLRALCTALETQFTRFADSVSPTMRGQARMCITHFQGDNQPWRVSISLSSGRGQTWYGQAASITKAAEFAVSGWVSTTFPTPNTAGE